MVLAAIGRLGTAPYQGAVLERVHRAQHGDAVEAKHELRLRPFGPKQQQQAVRLCCLNWRHGRLRAEVA